MQVQVGEILEGKVTGVKKFGAFVLLPGGTTGMVHISEVSNEYIQELADVLSEGQQVKVKVMNIAPDGKVALSIKRTLDAPAPQRQRHDRSERPERSERSPRTRDTGRVWQPKAAPAQNGGMSFEDMMSRFKSQSEERISDLRRVTEARRGGGGSYSRRR